MNVNVYISKMFDVRDGINCSVIMVGRWRSLVIVHVVEVVLIDFRNVVQISIKLRKFF